METKNDFQTSSIFSIIDQIQNEINKDTDKLNKNIIKNLKMRFSKNPEIKHYFKLYRKHLKTEIILNKSKIKQNKRKIDYLSSFDFDLAMDFIIKILSIVEEEQYEKRYFNVEKDIDITKLIPFKSEMPIYYSNSKRICLITTKNNMEKLSIFKDNVYYINSLKTILKDSKYIIIDKAIKYHFFESEKFKASNQLVTNYPYFESIIIDIIETRYKNPNLSQKEVMDKICNKVMDECLYIEKVLNYKL